MMDDDALTEKYLDEIYHSKIAVGDLTHGNVKVRDMTKIQMIDFIGTLERLLAIRSEMYVSLLERTQQL